MLFQSVSCTNHFVAKDKYLKKVFFDNQSKFNNVISNISKDSGPLTQYHKKSFFTYEVPNDFSTFVGVKYYAREFEGCRKIFVINHYEIDDWGVYVEEKGYLYIDNRDCLSPDEIVDNLDQYSRYELIKRGGVNEEWRYTKLKDNWYLFYRQYYQIFLH